MIVFALKLNIKQIGKDDQFLTFSEINPDLTIRELKNVIQNKCKFIIAIRKIIEIHIFIAKRLHPTRQSLRLSPNGRSLLNSHTIKDLEFEGEPTIYVKDLGPQIGWKTVFLCEYIGPIITYFFTYLRPNLPIISNIYDNPDVPMSYVVQ